MKRNYLTNIFVLFSIINIAKSTPLWLRGEPKFGTHLSINSRALEDYKLPTDVVPITYDVTLYPYLDLVAPRNFTFDGEAKINVVIVRPTKMIKMHAYDIKIESISVTDATENVIDVDNYTLSDNDKHFFTIVLKSTLELGAKYDINIKYKGKLNDDLEGFYRSSYKEEDGSIKWMAVTQFETTGARRAFPCFDEPAWKANFTLHIAHAPEHGVLANMPVSSEEILDDESLPGWNMTHFETSVLMSSYLVAFSVSEFQSFVHPSDPNYKDWARPSLKQYAKESNDMAPKVINYMTEFTGIEYALPKMDQIAIPDFAAGAMENWGLVTYRESAMLYIPDVSTTSNFLGVKSIVAHELAHQWFGNLVSPKWWSSIWLNEGFATYFSYDVQVTVYPEWDERNIFIQGEMHYAFQVDGLESTHPLLVYADNPSSLGAVFDTIAYSKGACIIHMMRNFMGDEPFKQGIHNYLSDMAYNSAEKDDLWRGLQSAVDPASLPEGQDFKSVMDTWVVQSGYPVVSVTRNYADKKIKLTQERFLTLRTGETNEVWWIPLTMTSQDAPDFETIKTAAWHSGPELELDVLASDKQWVILNVKQSGYYRVNYDENNWNLIINALTNKVEMEKIIAINRAQIIDDALAIARASLLDYNTALSTTEYLDEETHFTPWNAAMSALSYIYDRLAYVKETREYFEEYVLGKMAHMYELVGGFTIGEEETMSIKRSRSLVLSWYCKLNNDTCNTEAATMFDAWQATPETNPIDPDFKSVVYCAGMRKGDKMEYDFLFSKYVEYDNRPAEQSLILSALGCATNTTLLQSYLDETLKADSRIRNQDARSVLSSVYNNYIGVDIALDFLLTEYDSLLTVYNGLGTMQGAFTGIAKKLNTNQHRDKLQNFRDENVSGLESSMLSAIDSALKTLDETLAWQSEHRDIVVNYFRTSVDDAANVAQISSFLLLLVAVMYVLV